MVFDRANAATLLEHWGRLVEQAPRELTSFLYGFSRGRSHPLVRVSTIAPCSWFHIRRPPASQRRCSARPSRREGGGGR